MNYELKKCPKCGCPNDPDANFCKFCGKALREDLETQSGAERQRLRDEPKRRAVDYLGQSILMIFFCTPLAIVPVILALSARKLYACRDFETAEKRAKVARQFFWFSLVIGVVVQCSYLYLHWGEFVDVYNAVVAVVDEANQGKGTASDELERYESKETSFDATETESRGVETEPRGVETEPRGVETEPRGVETEPRGVETESLSDFLRTN